MIESCPVLNVKVTIMLCYELKQIGEVCTTRELRHFRSVIYCIESPRNRKGSCTDSILTFSKVGLSSTVQNTQGPYFCNTVSLLQSAILRISLVLMPAFAVVVTEALHTECALKISVLRYTHLLTLLISLFFHYCNSRMSLLKR